MGKIKLMTIVGTRPEIIKLSEVIKKSDKYFEHIIVHTGQNYAYTLNEIFFKDLSLREPDYYLGVVGDDLGETMGNIISKSYQLMQKVQPDAILILGDTNSALSAISAKRLKIPIFHMEAGNRCFDLRVPEEINRKIVDHTSDINMVLTEHARRYLIAEGIRPETIIKTGSSMMELFEKYKDQIDNSKILNDLNLESKKFFVVSAHREENIDYPENFAKLINSINKIAEKYQLPIIFSTHPRTRKKIEETKDLQLNKLVQFHKPFGFFDYIKLQKESLCVISDSGTITEESSILSFPAITIRNAHERPEGMDEGTLIMSGLDEQSVLDAINVTINQYKEETTPFNIIADYNISNVSKKVVKIILSYTGYVKRVVWAK